MTTDTDSSTFDLPATTGSGLEVVLANPSNISSAILNVTTEFLQLDIHRNSNDLEDCRDLRVYNFKYIQGEQTDLTQLLIQKMNENLEKNVIDFHTTMEILLKYIQLEYPFSKFFLMCETLPEKQYHLLYANAEALGYPKPSRQFVTQQGTKYLNKLCTKLFNFLKSYVIECDCGGSKDKISVISDEKLDNIFNDNFPDVEQRVKSEYKPFLKNSNFISKVQSLSRMDELMLDISSINGFMNCRQAILDRIQSKNMKGSSNEEQAIDIIKAVTANPINMSSTYTQNKLKALESALSNYEHSVLNHEGSEEDLSHEKSEKVLSHEEELEGRVLRQRNKRKVSTNYISSFKGRKKQKSKALKNNTENNAVSQDESNAGSDDDATNIEDSKDATNIEDTTNIEGTALQSFVSNHPIESKDMTNIEEKHIRLDDRSKDTTSIENTTNDTFAMVKTALQVFDSNDATNIEDSKDFLAALLGSSNVEEKMDLVTTIVQSAEVDGKSESPQIVVSSVEDVLQNVEPLQETRNTVTSYVEEKMDLVTTIVQSAEVDGKSDSPHIVVSSVEDVLQNEEPLKEILKMRNILKLDSFLRLFGPSEVPLKDGSTNDGWLECDVINCYMEILQKRDDDLNGGRENSQRSIFFNSHFFQKYHESGYVGVKRWTIKKDRKSIFECKQAFFPAHINGNHWVKIVIDVQNKRVIYCDSILSKNSSLYYLEKTSKYLEEEAKDKKVSGFNLKEWRFDMSKDMAQQQDGYNCGVFVLMSIRASAFDLTEDVLIREDIRNYRKNLFNEIVENKIIPLPGFDVPLVESETLPGFDSKLSPILSHPQTSDSKLSPIPDITSTSVEYGFSHQPQNFDSKLSPIPDLTITSMISETSNYSEDLMTEVEQRLRKLKEFLQREAPNIEFKYELVSNNTKTFSPIPSSNNHIITSGSAQPFGSSFSSTPIEKIQLEFKENTDDNNIKEDKKLNEYSNPVTVSLVKEDNLVTVSLVKTAMTSEDMITKTSFLHHGNTIFTTTTTPELLHSFHSMCITSFWHAISIYLNCCHLHSVHPDTDLYKGCLVHKEVFDELYRIFKQNPIIDTLLAKDGTIINPTTLSTVINKYLGSLYQSHRLKLTTITLSIPVKKTEEDQKAELLASFNEKVKSAVQTSGQEIADFSIILIDVLLFTKSRSQKLIDFPIVMMHIRENGTMVPYQTVGLVYECTSLNGSLYITKLVRREFWSPSKTQNDYNYKYQSFDILSGNTPVVHYPNPKNNTLKIPWSFVKQENNIYNLVGVLMVHNPGQKHSEPISHTLDDCEVVRISPNVNEIRFSDFKLLESNNPKQHNCWLEDTHMTEILEASCKKFNLLSFHHSFHHVVIRSSVFQEESMNVGTHEVSKSIWEYKNLFSVPKGYFHVAINYLDTHWVYVCFIVELKMVFYYDPDFKQETQNKVWPLLKTYIDLESKLVNTHKSWSFVTPKAFPRQKDSHNCGVFTCAAAIKLMWGVYMQQDVNEYVKSFLFPHESKDIVHYRKVFASVLSGSTESLSSDFLGKLDNKFKP